LFHPDLGLTFAGKINNVFGRLDSYLGGDSLISKFFARQASFEVYKI